MTGGEARTGPLLFGDHSNYFFARNTNDQQRLTHRFGMLRDDFNLWFDQALRLGGWPAGAAGGGLGGAGRRP